MRTVKLLLPVFLLVAFGSCAPTYPDGTPLTIIGSGKQCGVARDLDTFAEFWNNIGTDNVRANALLVLQDRLMLIPAGTKAELVGDGSPGDGLIKIRIKDGKYAGETGFLKKGEFRWDVK